MHTRVPPEKKPNPSFGGSNTSSNKKPLTPQRPVKKPNVRATDYRILMQLVLANSGALTQEEFLLLQSTIGYQEAMNIINEGKRRKLLRELGLPVTDVKVQPIQVIKQDGEATSLKEGLPENLKNGLEKISGVDLSDVNVHHNSDKPQQIGALAYTQGNDIHIGPGQKKHLLHEAWHAVQQKLGRVKQSYQMKTGVPVNDDAALEKEADIMGNIAEKEYSSSSTIQMNKSSKTYSKSQGDKVIQRKASDAGNTGNRTKQQTGKIKLYAPVTGLETVVDTSNTKTIEYLKNQGYSENPPNGVLGKVNWVLKVGGKNNRNDVIVLQKVLASCEYLDMPIDPATKRHVLFGTYGELTKQAVIKMQKKNGLKSDGIVGPDTWKAFPLPWNNVLNEPNRYSDKYQKILTNNNIYADKQKVLDDPDLRYAKLYDQGLKNAKKGTGRTTESEGTSNTTLGVGNFQTHEGGRYVLSLDKYNNIENPAAKVYCAWNATQPEMRIPVLKLNSTTYFASEFLIQLDYLYYRKRVDVTKLEVWQLDKIYETVHFDKIDMISAGVDAAAVISYNIAKGAIKYSDDIARVLDKGKTSKPIGKPFDPKGKVVQEGVDPNTLKPGKKLDTLDSNRQKNAVKYGGDKPIIVDRNGNVLDGHHRLNDAIQNGRAVDVQIGY